MKRMAWAIGLLLAVVVLSGAIGYLLPRAHVATVQLTLNQPISRVYDTVSDVARATQWRSDLEKVEILSTEPLLRWRETGDMGSLVMAREQAVRPTRLVNRIDDPTQPFSGRWIHELAPTATGTVLTITEEGAVSNPYFRLVSRFVFGHYRTLEQYTRDVSRHFGETTETTRVRQMRDEHRQ